MNNIFKQILERSDDPKALSVVVCSSQDETNNVIHKFGRMVSEPTITRKRSQTFEHRKGGRILFTTIRSFNEALNNFSGMTITTLAYGSCTLLAPQTVNFLNSRLRSESKYSSRVVYE